MVNELKPKNPLFPERTLGNDVINKNKDTAKKKKKRSPGMLAAIVLTFLLIVLMVTLAFFTSVDEVTNVFDAGRVDIILTESEWKPAKAKYVVPEHEIPKNPKVTNNEKTDVYVFLEVTVPYINNTEIEMSTPEGSKGQVQQASSVSNPVPLYKFGTANYNDADPPVITSYTYDTNLNTYQLINAPTSEKSGWKLVTHENFDNPKQNNDNTLTYVYAHVNNSNNLLPLMPGHTTQTALFDSVKVINFDENANLETTYKNISVKAYGIQANYLSDSTGEVGDNPYRVWKIIKP